MQINLSWDSSVSSAPIGFQSEVQQAASQLDAAILNPITVNIQVGWNEIGGTPMPANSGGLGGPSTVVHASYGPQNNMDTVALLQNKAALYDLPSVAASLPAANPFGSSYIVLSATQAKIFGIANPYATAFDGKIGLAMPGYTTSSEMITAALHEIAHALGRQNGWVDSSTGTPWYTPLDLYTYSAPGQFWNPTSTTPGYFSLDGGKTNLGNFSSVDLGDFVHTIIDPFSAGGYGIDTLTTLDNQVLQSLGFNLATSQVSLAAGQVAHVTPNSLITGETSSMVAYSGTESQYSITENSDGSITIQDTVASRDAGSNLAGVDRVQFTDAALAFDLGPIQSAGQAADLLTAAFGKAALSERVMVGNWINFFDYGGSMSQAAQDMVTSGNISASDNTSFVTKVWQNMVGAPIDSVDLATYTNDLANGAFTQASLLSLAANSSINQATAGIATLAQTGLAFTPESISNGISTVAYQNPSYDYTVTNNIASGIVTVSGQGNTDTLVNTQRLAFTDQSLAFDMGATQSGGQTAEILGAAFGTSALSNKTDVRIGLNLFDQGYTMVQVTQLAIGTGQVAGGSAAPSNTAFVEAVWQNVIGTSIDSADLATFTNDLANGTFTQASLLALAAETAANQSHVGLVGLATHGLAFMPA